MHRNVRNSTQLTRVRTKECRFENKLIPTNQIHQFILDPLKVLILIFCLRLFLLFFTINIHLLPCVLRYMTFTVLMGPKPHQNEHSPMSFYRTSQSSINIFTEIILFCKCLPAGYKLEHAFLRVCTPPFMQTISTKAQLK